MKVVIVLHMIMVVDRRALSFTALLLIILFLGEILNMNKKID